MHLHLPFRSPLASSTTSSNSARRIFFMSDQSDDVDTNSPNSSSSSDDDGLGLDRQYPTTVRVAPRVRKVVRKVNLASLERASRPWPVLLLDNDDSSGPGPSIF